MPFGEIYHPQMALGLLKATIEQKGIPVDVRYFSLAFAKEIGLACYHRIFSFSEIQWLLPDWIFSGCIFKDHLYEQMGYIDYLDDLTVSDSSLARVVYDARKVRSITASFLERCIESIDWTSYKIVGFTTTYLQSIASLALAKLIKERSPETIIVFGGACCSGEMGHELFKRFSFIDYVFSGDADISFPVFVDRVLQKQPMIALPGLIGSDTDMPHPMSYASQKNYNLDDLPFPNYDDYFEQLHEYGLEIQILPKVPVETSRGCWWGEKSQCKFCGLNQEGIAFRIKSSLRAQAEIDFLLKKYRVPLITTDSILPPPYFDQMLPGLGKSGVKAELFYQTKACLSKDQIMQLSKADVQTVGVGIESLHTHILRIMGKGTTALENIQFLKWCEEFGIHCIWLFLYGFPGESPDDYTQMAANIPSLIHLTPPVVFRRFRVDRFSPYFDSPAKYGLCNLRPALAYSRIYPFDEEGLSRLAWYFDYDLKDTRDFTYTVPLLDGLKVWQQRDPRWGFYLTQDKECVFLWDFRPNSSHCLTILSGVQKRIYQFCDQIHSRSEIADVVNKHNDDSSSSMFELEGFLAKMIEDRLMIKEGDTYLSLAVSVSSNS